MEAKTGDKAGTGGAMTIVDSSWKISFVLYSKYFPDQPDDVNVFWAYGQVSDVPGDFIRKSMQGAPAPRCSPSCSTTAAWRTRSTASSRTPPYRRR